MKKLKLILVPAVIIAVAAIVLNFTLQESAPAKEKEKTVNHEKKSCCAGDEMEAGKITEKSIYQLKSEWLNEYGKKINIESFKGKPVVLTMFFGNCTYACPMLVNDMRRIEANLSKDELNKYQFVLISIDPENDTPAKLLQYAKDRQLDLNRWTLLTGKQDNIMELAAVLGFKYKKEDNGGFSHSNIITLLDEKGEMRWQLTGLNQDVAETVNTLKNL